MWPVFGAEEKLLQVCPVGEILPNNHSGKSSRLMVEASRLRIRQATSFIPVYAQMRVPLLSIHWDKKSSSSLAIAMAEVLEHQYEDMCLG